MYREYFRLNPEKYEGIKNLKVRSNEIRNLRKERARERREKIEKFQRLLDEERKQQ